MVNFRRTEHNSKLEDWLIHKNCHLVDKTNKEYPKPLLDDFKRIKESKFLRKMFEINRFFSKFKNSYSKEYSRLENFGQFGDYLYLDEYTDKINSHFKGSKKYEKLMRKFNFNKNHQNYDLAFNNLLEIPDDNLQIFILKTIILEEYYREVMDLYCNFYTYLNFKESKPVEKLKKRWEVILKQFSKKAGLFKDKVTRLSYAKLGDQMFILKKLNSPYIYEEKDVTKEFKKLNQITSLKFPHYYGVLSKKGSKYQVMRTIDGRLLSDQTDPRIYLDISLRLSTMMYFIDSKKGKRDYKRDVERRVRTYNDKNFNSILKDPVWKTMWDELKEQIYCFDNDPHGDQFMVKYFCEHSPENSEYYFLDNEDKGMLQPSFQWNKFIIQSGLKGKYHESLLKEIYGKFYEDQIRKYELAAIPSAMSYCVIGEDLEYKLAYLNEAIKFSSQFSFNEIKNNLENFKSLL